MSDSVIHTDPEQVFTKLAEAELETVYWTSFEHFAEILSKMRTSSLVSVGGKFHYYDLPPKGRNGFILTDHLPPVKMTKIYHRLRELEKLKVKDFELRFGEEHQWQTGIMCFTLLKGGCVSFYVQQFGENRIEDDHPF